MRRPMSMGGSRHPSFQIEEVLLKTTPNFYRNRPQSVFDAANHRHLTFSDFKSKRISYDELPQTNEGPKVLFLDLSKNRVHEISLSKQLNIRQQSQFLQRKQPPTPTDSQ